MNGIYSNRRTWKSSLKAITVPYKNQNGKKNGDQNCDQTFLKKQVSSYGAKTKVFLKENEKICAEIEGKVKIAGADQGKIRHNIQVTQVPAKKTKKRTKKKKMSNLGKSIITLMSGCGFLVIVIGLFTELYEFWPWSVIGGIGIGILVTFLITLFGISDSGGGKARASVEFEYKP